MWTKIEAADVASRCGTPTVIASATHPNVLIEIAEGKKVGTTFLSVISQQESRKRWLLSEKKQGSIHVDAGASSKISHHGASLLPSGITKIERTFERGAIVQIVDPAGKEIAVGISNYDSKEIGQLLGHQSSEIEIILGYSYGPEVVHRMNMTRIKSQEETVV